MTGHRDPDELLAAYLADGMEVLPDRVVDAVLDEVHRTRRRAVFGPWRTQRMNSVLKFALAAAAVVAVVVAGMNFLPRNDGGVGGPGGAASPSPVVTPSPEPSPSPQALRITVAGTANTGTPVHLTVKLPQGWTELDDGANAYGANRGGSEPPAGTAFIVSLVDNTFKDPCTQIQRSPKIGSTVGALATALGEIPNTTATAPVQTTLAGLAATYIAIAVPASLPCPTSQFYLWQDSPKGDWWVQGLNETVGVWIFEVGGQRLVVATHSYPGTGAAAKAELQGILDSIVFDPASSSASPAPS